MSIIFVMSKKEEQELITVNKSEYEKRLAKSMRMEKEYKEILAKAKLREKEYKRMEKEYKEILAKSMMVKEELQELKLDVKKQSIENTLDRQNHEDSKTGHRLLTFLILITTLSYISSCTMSIEPLKKRIENKVSSWLPPEKTMYVHHTPQAPQETQAPLNAP